MLSLYRDLLKHAAHVLHIDTHHTEKDNLLVSQQVLIGRVVHNWLA